MNGAVPGTYVPVGLRTNRRIEPLGLGDTRPRLSWTLAGPAEPEYVGFQVQTATDDTFASITWDTGQVADPAPGIRYTGPRLTSRQRLPWRVRALTTGGGVGPWSEVAHFEMGLLEHADWAGEWIGVSPDETGRPAYFSTQTEVPAAATRGRLYVSALGWMRVFAGDRDLTEGTLVPRFTPFDDEVEYVTFDLDDAAPGPLTVSIVVGDGRFRGALGMHGTRDVYGDRVGVLVQIDWHLADGTRFSDASGTHWSGGHGARSFADPKDGETIDLTRCIGGRTETADEALAVTVLPPHPRALVAEETDPMRQVRTLAPVAVRQRDDGSTLVDFGQNFTGVVRVRLPGERGRVVTLQHAEDLDAHGQLDWAHLDHKGAGRTDRPHRFQRDEVVLDGAPRWVQPWFTYHGFRYVQITGLDQALDPDDIQAVVLSSVDADPEVFSSSSDPLTRLYRNVVWSMTGNFLDTATDCPTRERGGFTGDAQVFAPTARAIADVDGFFGRYLRSLTLDQLPDGRIPMIIPREYSPFSGSKPEGMAVTAAGSVGWGDAAVILPWILYQASGDTRVLEDQYASAKLWVEFLHRKGARRGLIWGEWLRAGENMLAGAIRDNSLNRKNIGLAYLAHSAALLAKIAAAIGHNADAERYTEVTRVAVHDWRKTAVRWQGRRIGADRQDDYVRALAFDLLEPDHRAHATARLAVLIEKAGGHLGTGFLSTPMLLPVLAEAGHRDLAYRLLFQQSPPGWQAQVLAGATTIGESWVEPGKDGTRVGSSNHYAFGAVAAWIVSDVVGLTPLGIGRRRVRFQPWPGGGLTWVRGELTTDFGPVRAAWRLTGGHITATLEIPLGVTVDLPPQSGHTTLSAGTHVLEWDAAVTP